MCGNGLRSSCIAQCCDSMHTTRSSVPLLMSRINHGEPRWSGRRLGQFEERTGNDDLVKPTEEEETEQVEDDTNQEDPADSSSVLLLDETLRTIFDSRHRAPPPSSAPHPPLSQKRRTETMGSGVLAPLQNVFNHSTSYPQLSINRSMSSASTTSTLLVSAKSPDRSTWSSIDADVDARLALSEIRDEMDASKASGAAGSAKERQRHFRETYLEHRLVRHRQRSSSSPPNASFPSIASFNSQQHPS